MQAPLALVAEDEAICRMDVAALLGSEGYDVLEAASADEAWSILLKRNADLLLFLTDVDMPGELDGLALANRVHQSWGHINVVVCSGRYEPADGDLPPPVMFLGKPVDRMTLIEKARATVQARVTWNAQNGAPEPFKAR